MHCLTSAGRSLRAAQSGAALGAVVAESAEEIAVGASIFSQVHLFWGGPSCGWIFHDFSHDFGLNDMFSHH